MGGTCFFRGVVRVRIVALGAGGRRPLVWRRPGSFRPPITNLNGVSEEGCSTSARLRPGTSGPLMVSGAERRQLLLVPQGPEPR